MGIYQTGFEFPDLAWLQQQGWEFSGATIVGGVDSVGPRTHLTPWGAGGIYALQIDGLFNTAPRVGDPDTNRWFHAWIRHINLGGNADVNIRFNYDGLGALATNAAVRIQEDDNGAKVQILRGNGTVVATSVSSIDNSVGHWIEIEMRCQNSPDGLCNVYVDGVLFVTFTGDLQAESESGWDRIQYVTGNIIVDDMIITDSTEGRLTEEYFGFLQPLSGDQSTALTPSAGSENYLNVAGPSINTSTYNGTTAGAGTEDLYTTRRTRWVDTVYGVQVSAYLGKSGQYTGAGNNSQLAVRSGSTTGTSATENLAASVFQTQAAFFSENPDTTSPWTESDLDDLAVGVNTAT